MPFRFRRGQISGGEARRIAREQIDRALGELEDESLDRDTQIHQARKRCKKLRGFLRLCRPALGEVFQRENRALRDAARLISGTRDRKVLLDTCRSLAANPGESAEPGAVDSVLEALEASYESHVQEGQEVEKKIESFKSRLRGVRRRIGKMAVGHPFRR
jgi:CHAD domain-containing protein